MAKASPNPAVCGISNLFSEDCMKEVTKLVDNAAHFVEEKIGDVAKEADKAAHLMGEKIGHISTDATEGLREVQAAWANVVTDVSKLEKLLVTDSPLDKRALDEFATSFSARMEQLGEQLQAEFELPLPEDEDDRYKHREALINKALNMIEDVLVAALSILGVPEGKVRQSFGHIKPHIAHAILVVVNLAENHPLILEVAFGAVLLLIPEASLLRPIIRLFGIGPGGIGKGTAASAAQRFFFGGAIPKNSWFSWLQKAGMTKARL